MVMSLSKFRELVKDREAWLVAVRGVTKSRTRLSNQTAATPPVHGFVMVDRAQTILQVEDGALGARGAGTSVSRPPVLCAVQLPSRGSADVQRSPVALHGSHPDHRGGREWHCPHRPDSTDSRHTQGPAWSRASEVQAGREPGLDPWVGAASDRRDQAFWAEAMSLTSEKLEEEGGKAHAVGGEC